MTDRGPVTRCSVRGCPFVGFFAAYSGRCPSHREDHRLDFLNLDVPDEHERR